MYIYIYSYIDVCIIHIYIYTYVYINLDAKSRDFTNESWIGVCAKWMCPWYAALKAWGT